MTDLIQSAVCGQVLRANVWTHRRIVSLCSRKPREASAARARSAAGMAPARTSPLSTEATPRKITEVKPESRTGVTLAVLRGEVAIANVPCKRCILYENLDYIRQSKKKQNQV